MPQMDSAEICEPRFEKINRGRDANDEGTRHSPEIEELHADLEVTVN